MNPNVPGRMGPGCAYKSRLGIQGIKAVDDGYDAFMAFAFQLATDWGETYSANQWSETEQLTRRGYILIGPYCLVFFSGAKSASHGSMVLGGMSDESANRAHNGFNARVSIAVDNEFNALFTGLPSSISEFFIFGHSYGAVEAECLGNAMAGAFPGKAFYVETYGSPRPVHVPPCRIRSNHVSTRNLIVNDVVSHIPYYSTEAPLASRFTLASIRAAFNASGHTTRARIFSSNGTYTIDDNNAMEIENSTTSLLLWVTYANHITHRAHELNTYVSVMDAFAIRDPRGTLPPATTTSVPFAGVNIPGPVNGNTVTGAPPDPQSVNNGIEEEENRAIEIFNRTIFRSSATAMAAGGVFGAGFGGIHQVSASNRRRAKHLAKVLNRLRRLLGPLDTEQRSLVIEAVLGEFENGPIV